MTRWKGKEISYFIENMERVSASAAEDFTCMMTDSAEARILAMCSQMYCSLDFPLVIRQIAESDAGFC